MGNVLSNREAELSVIGSMMQGATCDLTADDFTDKELCGIFCAIEQQRMENAPTDLVTLNTITRLTTALIEANGAAMPSLIKHHAGLVRECSVRRRAGEIARQLHNAVGEHLTAPDAAIDHARQQLLDLLGGQCQEWTEAPELAKSTLEYFEKLSGGKIKPISTSIRAMDNLIGGLYPGELTVIGAKPGTGKTVMGMVIALDAAKKGRKVGIMNLEMLDTQYGARIFANLGNVDAMNLRKGTIFPDEWSGIVRAAAELAKLPAAFMFKSRFIEDLWAAVRNKDLDMLVVDYMQLVRTRQSFESERLRMGYVSWALKEIAMERRIPVVAMSQLRRSDPSVVDKMPSMRDLRESGNLEADADGVILLHEPPSIKDPYVFKDDHAGFEEWKKQGLRYIAMKVDKQRQGKVGTVPVLFDGSRMKYREIIRDK